MIWRGFYFIVTISALFLVLMASTVRASQQDITLKLNDYDQRALTEMLDIATKSCGLRCAATSIEFLRRMEEARKTANGAPVAPPATPGR